MRTRWRNVKNWLWLDSALITTVTKLPQIHRNEGNSCKGEPCYAPSDLSSFLVPFWTLCQTHLRSWSHFDRIGGCKVAQMHFKTGSAILSYQSDSLFSSSQPILWLRPKTFFLNISSNGSWAAIVSYLAWWPFFFILGLLHWSSIFPPSREHRNIVQLCTNKL